MQVDTLCICGSLVIESQKAGFSIDSVLKGLKQATKVYEVMFYDM